MTGTNLNVIHNVTNTISLNIQPVQWKSQKCDRTIFCSPISHLLFRKYEDKNSFIMQTLISIVFVVVSIALQWHSMQALTVSSLIFMSLITLQIISGGHVDPPMIPGNSTFLLELI